MAADPFVFPDKASLNFLALGLLGLTSGFKMILVASSWTPAPATDELLADVTGELAAGNGYLSGGVALTGVALSQAAGVAKFTAAPASWAASGGSIPAWRRGVVYYAGTISGKVNPLVGYFLGDSTPADVPATTAGNSVTVFANTLGYLSATSS